MMEMMKSGNWQWILRWNLL